MCGSLVTIENGSFESSQNLDACGTMRTSDKKTITTDVRVAHSSVQEYLIGERIRLGPAKSYSIRETDSSEAIAEHCLAYVLHASGHSKPLDQTIKKSPLILSISDVDVNALGGKYLHALQAASVAGHERIVQMLLDKGADINVQGGEHGTALQAAVYWGREKT
ncbi:MAG: hypothetical protein Q9161_000657 [Pseudevernia consocians]